MDFQVHAVSWNLTKRCNLRCAHCYLDAEFRAGLRADELSTGDCLRIADDIARVNPKALLILTGGEPLLRPDLYAVAAHAAGRGFFVVVATNGTTVTGRNAEKLAAAGVKGVSLSLHSSRPEKHDSFTAVPGSWQGAVDGAVRLRETGLEFAIQTSVMAWNYDEVPRIAALACELGARFFNLYFLVCTGRGQTLTDLPPGAREEMLRRLYEMQKRYLGRLLINAKCAPQYKRVIYESNPNSPFLKSYAGGCPAATHYCQIDPRGQVTPCPYLPVPAGNALQMPFAEIWRQAPLLKDMRDRSQLEGRCGRCEFRSLCGGCRARAYAEAGSYRAEDPSCSYEPGARSGQEIRLAEDETLGRELEFKLPWEPEARERLERIPSFARGMVVWGVEHFARQHDCAVVTAQVMQRAREAIGARKGTSVPHG